MSSMIDWQRDAHQTMWFLSSMERELRRVRKLLGRCPKCGKTPAPGRTCCEDCLCYASVYQMAHPRSEEEKAKERERARRRREYRISHGLCLDCGKPVYKQYRLCYEHHLYHNRKQREYYQRRRLETDPAPKKERVYPTPPKPGINHPWRQAWR